MPRRNHQGVQHAYLVIGGLVLPVAIAVGIHLDLVDDACPDDVSILQHEQITALNRHLRSRPHRIDAADSADLLLLFLLRGMNLVIQLFHLINILFCRLSDLHFRILSVITPAGQSRLMNRLSIF